MLSLALIALLAVAPGSSVLVETVTGAVHVGVVVADDDQAVVLDVDGTHLTLPKTAVARVTVFRRAPGQHYMPQLPPYPLAWVNVDGGFGFDYFGGGFSYQKRSLVAGTVRAGGWREETSGEIRPGFQVATISFMATGTLKTAFAHVSLSAGPSISSGSGRGRFLGTDGNDVPTYKERSGYGVGITGEVRVVVGAPYLGLGVFILLDANTFYPYGTIGFTLELGRVSRLRPCFGPQ